MEMKKIRVLSIIFIIALFAFGLVSYWVAIPTAVFIPVGCALCTVCVYFLIRMLWPKGKLFAIAQVLLLCFLFTNMTVANIEKNLGPMPHWFNWIMISVYVPSLVLFIILGVRQYNQNHKKTEDGAAETGGKSNE